MKFVDLFCGIGSFHIAMREQGMECVMASDIFAEARDTYEANHGLRPRGDVCDIDPSEVPAYDVVCAGFPCQPFSRAGRKGGRDDDPRGTLFDQVIKFAARKPRYIVLENVTGVLTINDGKDYATMRAMLDAAGYHVDHRVLRCADYGIPQNRVRAFIVAVRKDLPDNVFEFLPEPSGRVTLSHFFGRDFARDTGFTIRCGGRRSGIGNRHNWDTYLVDGKEYTLSVDDCRRLQGLPDGFVWRGCETKRYRMLGNTIPTCLSRAVATMVAAHARATAEKSTVAGKRRPSS